MTLIYTGAKSEDISEPTDQKIPLTGLKTLLAFVEKMEIESSSMHRSLKTCQLQFEGNLAMHISVSKTMGQGTLLQIDLIP